MTIDFDSFFQKLPAPCMVLDSNLVFVAANPAYLDMVGKTADDVLGQHVFEVFPETTERVESMTALFRDVLAGNDATFAELPFRILKDGQIHEHWWTAHHARFPSADGTQDYLIQFSENVTDTVRARDLRNALMAEMQHRIGNILSIINAIARQTGRSSKTVPEFLDAFGKRVSSLVSANRRLAGQGIGGDALAEVIAREFEMHGEGARERVTIKGPRFDLSLLQSQAVSMAIHELSTNSLKYGALSNDTGTLSVSWDLTPSGGCILTWHETGLAPVDADAREGYGTTLLTRIIPDQLNGSATRIFADGALVYTLEINTPNS